LSSGEFKLKLNEFHVILKRLFAIKEATTIAKALLTVDAIGRRLNVWINISARLLLICDSRCF
jgi:hypothetical protein